VESRIGDDSVGGGTLRRPFFPMDSAQRLLLPIRPVDHAHGPTDAPYTLIEYGDYECPDCGCLYVLLRDLQSDVASRLRVVFWHYPLFWHSSLCTAGSRSRPREVLGNSCATFLEQKITPSAAWELYDLGRERSLQNFMQTSFAGRQARSSPASTSQGRPRMLLQATIHSQLPGRSALLGGE